MKKYIFILGFIFLANLNSQWQTDVRLTNDPADSYTTSNNAWYIMASGNVVNIVWTDNRDGNYEIYFKRSTNQGVNWQADTRLTNAPATSSFASVSVYGPAVHVIWNDGRDGNAEIYYKRSTDGGVSWGTDIRLTNNSANSAYPSFSVSGSVLHVVWYDERDGNREIYYKRSTDGGVSWGADTRLTYNSFSSQSPSVSVSDSDVHVLWEDASAGNWEIHYKHSSDGGINWQADIRLTNNSSYSFNPSISVSGLVVHVVWHDFRDGNAEIYYKRSTNEGISWGTDTRLTNYTGISQTPSISVSGSAVHILWYDDRNGNYEIYYKLSPDGGLSWGTDVRLTNNTGTSRIPSISISGSAVHAVWNDNRDGNYEIYYKRNPTGNPVGIINVNTEIPNEFKLSQNYPNPFNPITNIEFSIPKSGFVNLTIYDAMGREVEALVNQNLSQGTYKADWDASNYPSGVYFYKLSSSDFSETKKMVLIK